MSGDTGESKTEDASSSKLRKQREKGQFLKSQNFPTHLKYCVGMGLIYGFARYVLDEFEIYFTKLGMLIGHDTQRTDILILIDLNINLVIYLLFFVLILIIFSFLAHGFFSGGFPISFELIKLKFNNINPGQGLKRIFGRRQQTETWVGVFQCVVWISLALLIVYRFFDPAIASLTCGLGCTGMVAYELFFYLIGLSILILIFAIAFDLIIQQSLFNHEMKMTKSESTRDQKDAIGDPLIKQQIRRRGYELLFGDNEELITEYTDVKDSSFVLVGKKTVVAIRFSYNDKNPIPIVVLAASIEQGASILNNAQKTNKKILTNESLADEIGVNIVPGSVLDETHFSKLSGIMKREKNN